jgi:polysaccharide deacetylase family protein (PEP-CTERM system associated)
VVGELAEKHPEIIEDIKENGHEIAFHGYHHEPLWNLDADTLRTEIQRFNSLIGEKCSGFRAPSFSLSNKTRWSLKVLENSGYQYDSSLFPVKTPLYGVWNAPTKPYKPSHENITINDESARLWEFPLLVYKLKGIRVPVAGGFYLRFFSVDLIAKAIKKLNKLGFPAVIFFHNWELDSETPRLKLGLYKYFVTYHKLKETSKKLENLLSRFQFTSIKEYMVNYIA